MNRRTFLRSTGAAAVAVPGCSMLGGCGPGEDAIEDVAADVEKETPTPDPEATETAEVDEVSLKGTIESHSEDEIIIDDGTGRAALMAIGGFYMKNIEGGECAFASGFPTSAEDRDDADVTLIITEVGLED